MTVLLCRLVSLMAVMLVNKGDVVCFQRVDKQIARKGGSVIIKVHDLGIVFIVKYDTRDGKAGLDRDAFEHGTGYGSRTLKWLDVGVHATLEHEFFPRVYVQKYTSEKEEEQENAGNRVAFNASKPI